MTFKELEKVLDEFRKIDNQIVGDLELVVNVSNEITPSPELGLQGGRFFKVKDINFIALGEWEDLWPSNSK